MKQISQNYRSGAIRVEETRAPRLRAGGVLVRTCYSVVSAGTEGMKVREAKLSYLGKARARPEQVKKVLETLRQQGVSATYQKVMNKLDRLTPLGYSLSGEIIAVGEGAEEFEAGQRVACAGAGYANHAEVNFVPRNLAVPVPDDVSLKHAAFATVGAIAMQGFRQSGLRLGESACVVGLGLMGQLLVQILRAAGVHVIGIDPMQGRCELARRLGVAAFRPDDVALRAAVDRATGGHGADAVLLTAGARDNGPLELAVELARDRARVVDIGKTRLDLPWNACYLKELDVRFSRSYGPGRYDPVYEEQGVDYPVGYVRWTERRNMASFLELVADGRVQLDSIISAVHPFTQAERVYADMANGRYDGLATVFEYAPADERPDPRAILAARGSGRARPPARVVRLGLVGAGNYAATMLLPHLRDHDRVRLQAVATATGLSAADAARKFGFRDVTTDYREVLEDPQIDAVVIATRHSTHARMAADALRAGKAVYVEKPLALGLAQLGELAAAIRQSGNDRLMVGFNRRFAPAIRDLAAHFPPEALPLAVHYRVHAGQLEEGSWYLDRREGTRFAGEGGHFLDTVSFITGSRPVSVHAQCLRPAQPGTDDLENLAVIVRMANGSLANVLYLTQGAPATPKEYLEIFGGGRTAQMSNFESSLVYDGPRARRRRWRVDKGQRDQLARFVECVLAGAPMPIPLDSLFDTTLATLAVERSLRSGTPVALAQLFEELQQPTDAEVSA